MKRRDFLKTIGITVASATVIGSCYLNEWVVESGSFDVSINSGSISGSNTGSLPTGSYSGSCSGSFN